MKYLKAAILPVIGVFLSVLVLKPEPIETKSPLAREPLARIQRSETTLKKKDSNSNSWKSVSEGEALYKGDEIQTPTENGAVLEFFDTGSSIELEPDSTIVIEKGEKNFSLNILNGGLFVKKGQGIDLKSKGQSISFEGDVSFSTNDQGKGELKVIKGKATAKMGDKTFNISENELASMDGKAIKKELNIFNITSPEYLSFYYFEQDNIFYRDNQNLGNKVKVKWKPIAEDIEIGIELGKNPRKLERLYDIKTDAKSGEIIFPVKPGTFYWRLISLNDKRVSTTQKNTFRTVQYPVPRSPQNGQVIYMTEEELTIKLGFSSLVPLDSGEIQISTDKNFKNLLDKIQLTGSKFYQTNKITKEGSFFWRVTGNLEGSTYKVTSNTASFKTQFITGTLPPLLISPPDGHQILNDTGKPVPVNFQWKAQDALSKHKYRFTLQNLNNQSKKLVKEIEQSFLNVKRIPFGTYEWKVELLDNKDKVSAKSQERKLQIMNIPELVWNIEKDKYLFLNDMPIIPLNWSNASEGFLNYRILTSTNKEFQQILTYTTKDAKFEYKPQMASEYFFKVEAVDKQGRVLARSKPIQITVEQVPFAKPPRFLPSGQQTFQADATGKIELSFKPAKQSAKIFIELKDENGNIVGQHTWKKTKGTIEALLPGEYWIYAKSIDKHGRVGQDSEKRKLLVPNKTKLEAPKVKNIQVR